MLRLFHPLEEIPETVRITGEKAHYLATVLRCKAGDEIVIFDGKGSSYKAFILSVTKKEVSAEVKESFKEESESPLHIILLQGLLKGEKMDLVIQKTTELGVIEVVPVITERSQVRETKKAGRWRKIAEDAARQSGRSVVPAVHEPVELPAFLLSAIEPGPHGKVRGIVFWEERGSSLTETRRRITSETGPLYLLIGPEGGLTGEEVLTAESRGFVVTSLGPRILRTETAAIAATALAQFLFGDLG